MNRPRTAIAALLLSLGIVPTACVSDDVGSSEVNATETGLKAAPLGVPVLLAQGQVSFLGSDELQLTFVSGPENSRTTVQRRVKKLGSDSAHPANNTPIDLGSAWLVEVPDGNGGTTELKLVKNPKQKFGFDNWKPSMDSSAGGDLWTCQQAQLFATGVATIEDPEQLCRVEINSMGNQDVSIAIIGLDDQMQGLTSFSCESEKAPVNNGGAVRLIEEGPAQVATGVDDDGNPILQQLYNVKADPALTEVLVGINQDLVTEDVHRLERADCLKNALGSVFSDLQAHFYCAIPLEVRECYVPAARANGAPAAFQSCFAAHADGDPATSNSPQEIVAEKYGAAFAYVMFNKNGAFNIQSENDIINDAYGQLGEERPRRFNDTYPEALDNQPRYAAAELNQIRALGSLEDPRYLEINNEAVNPPEGYVCTPNENGEHEFKTITFPPDTKEMLVKAPADYYADSIVDAGNGLPMMPPQLIALAKTPYEYLQARKALVDGGQLDWDHPLTKGEFPARTMLAALRRLKRYYWTQPYRTSWSNNAQITAEGTVGLTASHSRSPSRNTPVDADINFYSTGVQGVTSETWSDIQGVFFSSVPNYRHSCLTSSFREAGVKEQGEISFVRLGDVVPNLPQEQADAMLPVQSTEAQPRDTCGEQSLNRVVHKFCSAQFESATDAETCGTFDDPNTEDLFQNPIVSLSEFLSAYNLLWVDPETMTFVPVPEHVRRNIPEAPTAEEGLVCPTRNEESSIDEAMESPAAKFAREQREAGMFNVWGYVIESQLYAFDYEMQQAIINAVFNDDKRFAEGEDYTGPFDPCDPTACNTWRSYKRYNEGKDIDPRDGTHCRTDKTLLESADTLPVSLGPWGR